MDGGEKIRQAHRNEGKIKNDISFMVRFFGCNGKGRAHVLWMLW